MPEQPAIVLSAFADEAANHKTAVEQLAALAALGLRYYSPRFVDVTGSGTVEHVVELSDEKLAQLKALHDEYGMSVTSIGSRIGKVKLLDVDDGTHNKYVELDEYLKTEVANTIRAANALGAKLVRGFSFYHPQTEAPEGYVDQAVEKLKPIVDECAKNGLVYGLEVEANLIGQNGRLLAELATKVDSPHLVCIFDGGNLSSQNMSWMEVFDEYVAMRDHIGWIHIKDYKVDPGLTWTGVVDEERLKNFVPANIGDSAHEAILRDLREHLPEMTKKMQAVGVPGVFLELEPHLKGGGQFGGFSGPDGMGVAVRALCSVLDYVGIDYSLRTMDDIREARGF
ncbi:MAG: sugar phosphate isomerase/epimerase family protein [Maioricimonas sp. JB045]|uniref:sugar phosphate isomerase/epimerase family protein n=1 Tax=Maioricimonas sp. JC845 TaxID=3232138 RepID=UPI0034583A42